MTEEAISLLSHFFSDAPSLWGLLLGPIGGLLGGVYFLGVLTGIVLVMRFYLKVRIDSLEKVYAAEIQSMKEKIEHLEIENQTLKSRATKWDDFVEREAMSSVGGHKK